MKRSPLEIAAELERESGGIIAYLVHAPCLDEAAACIREMHATIERLPKTADGVPIAPGMMVWVPDYMTPYPDDGECLVTSVINYGACSELKGNPEAQRAFRHAGNDCCYEHCDDATDACKSYSTREAAEAARIMEAKS